MRPEQAAAVDKTHAYFRSIWEEDMHAVPRFLWNAKMRFGKTFTTYQLAKKLGAKRVLVVTFKPAVEDAWQTDLRIPRRLRRLAVPVAGQSAGTRRRSTATGRWSTSARSRTCSAATRPATSRPRTVAPRDQLGPRGLRRVPLRRLARHRQGAVRGRGRRGRQEGAQARVRRRPRGGQRGPDELCETETEFLPITTGPTCTSRARRSRRWPRVSSSRSRSSTGPTQTSSAPSRSSPTAPGRAGTRTPPCRRCACSPTRCPTS